MEEQDRATMGPESPEKLVRLSTTSAGIHSTPNDGARNGRRVRRHLLMAFIALVSVPATLSALGAAMQWTEHLFLCSATYCEVPSSMQPMVLSAVALMCFAALYGAFHEIQRIDRLERSMESVAGTEHALCARRA
jgi:hypothetical protein